MRHTGKRGAWVGGTYSARRGSKIYEGFSIFSLLCTLSPKFYIISYNYQNHFSFLMSISFIGSPRYLSHKFQECIVISFIGSPRYLSHKFQECIVICNTHCLATTTSEEKLHILKIWDLMLLPLYRFYFLTIPLFNSSQKSLFSVTELKKSRYGPKMGKAFGLLYLSLLFGMHILPFGL
jgi:hypothetical protein